MWELPRRCNVLGCDAAAAMTAAARALVGSGRRDVGEGRAPCAPVPLPFGVRNRLLASESFPQLLVLPCSPPSPRGCFGCGDREDGRAGSFILPMPSIEASGARCCGGGTADCRCELGWNSPLVLEPLFSCDSMLLAVLKADAGGHGESCSGHSRRGGGALLATRAASAP